jgi:hypothetical protein
MAEIFVNLSGGDMIGSPHFIRRIFMGKMKLRKKKG